MNYTVYKLFVIMLFPNILFAQNQVKEKWEWGLIDTVADPIGYAGAFVGTVNDFLVVIGGANFPDGKAPWEGGKKVWSKKSFILKSLNGKFQHATPLPDVPLGYGASVSYKGKMYIAAGSNEQEHSKKAYEVSWNETLNNIQFKELSDLPTPIANCASIVFDDYWYIVGGIMGAEDQKAQHVLWKLDLRNPESLWEKCPDFPAEGRMLSVLGASENHLYLFSGVALVNGQRKYLKDAYRLSKNDKWEKLPDLPWSTAAAAGPAYFDHASNALYIIGGDDGKLAHSNLGYSHPGFSNHILKYDMDQMSWELAGEVEIKKDNQAILIPVTTGTILWKKHIVFPMGEIRPGIRTNQVIIGRLKTENR